MMVVGRWSSPFPIDMSSKDINNVTAVLRHHGIIIME